MKSKSLYLSKIELEDLDILYKWFSDIEFLKNYDYVNPIPQTKDQVNKMILDFESDEESKVFAIKLNNTNKIIAIGGFCDIVKDNEVATFFIGIGDKKERGKGYGKEAMNLILDYGFNNLKLYKIQLNVLEFNNTAINLYEKIGFIREGILREFVLRDKKRYDLLLYGMFRNERRLEL